MGFLLAEVHFCATSLHFEGLNAQKGASKWPQDGPKMASRPPQICPTLPQVVLVFVLVLLLAFVLVLVLVAVVVQIVVAVVVAFII